MQVALPPRLKVAPSTQGRHAAASADAYVPAGHAAHEAAPASAKEPAAHGAHWKLAPVVVWL